MRLGPGPLPALCPVADVVLWPVAVEPRGMRSAVAPVVSDVLFASVSPHVVIVLDHAGPTHARWSRERSVGPVDVVEPVSGRRPLALDEAGWSAIINAYVGAAGLCRRHGVPFVLGVDNDGLLHATLRAGDRARILAVHRAVGHVDVALVVEELCPGGLDATDGIAIARDLVAQGATRIYASAGTDALPALRRREKGGSTSGSQHLLASAAWLVGRVPVNVVATVPRDGDALAAQALALGLHGVVTEETA